ncbi:MAG: GTPase HflX [Candidatus Sumerlaeota bacterium]
MTEFDGSVLPDNPPERAYLVGLVRDSYTEDQAAESLAELERLVDSAGGDIIGTTLVRLRNPHPATLISKGHLENIADEVAAHESDLVVIDDDLSPVQQRNLEKTFETRVVTRTEVILDIFATHANTRESMTQVELAQLRYHMPRLIGAGIASARMGGVGAGASGGIATRGPGETQLEVDRRRIRSRVRRLEETLKEIEKQRQTQRRRRQRSNLPMVGLVGYTNAGKSTLLNQLTHAGVLAQDRLFSTLDSTVRSLSLPNGMEVGLIDTVGFVSKLPPTLVAAFHATLEEIVYADLIIHVVDSTSHRLDEEFEATDEILKELNCDQTQRLTVWNKIDLMDDPVAVAGLELRRTPSAVISALKGKGIDELLEKMQTMLMADAKTVELRVPYDHYDLVARLHRESRVLETRDAPKGELLRCRIGPELQNVVKPYLIDEWPEEEES